MLRRETGLGRERACRVTRVRVPKLADSGRRFSRGKRRVSPREKPGIPRPQPSSVWDTIARSLRSEVLERRWGRIRRVPNDGLAETSAGEEVRFSDASP